MTPTAIAGLNEVLLLAALRAERKKGADALAKEIAQRWDRLAEKARGA